jgi:Ser/Thr protein kinase RdoA (MazF antagonist)
VSSVHDLSDGPAVLAGTAALARRALDRYSLSPRARVGLLSVSENATYLVEDEDADFVGVLRVHRRGYHTREAIRSELAWLEALRRDRVVRTPRVIAASDGAPVVTVASPDRVAARECVMFQWLPGREPSDNALVETFAELGALTARMHRHARVWRRPPWFSRFHWNYDAALGEESRWGRWQDGVGLGEQEHALLGRLAETLRTRLERFGRGPERYGLIHADLRLANLLVDGPRVGVIDFDDCGFGWYLYDLAAALSFMEHDPRVPTMIDSWLAGYRTVLALPAEDAAEAWTFVMFRRLLLVAWISSHSAAEIAGRLGADYTRGTCELAERYLSAFG